jgi:hypothetical protein
MMDDVSEEDYANKTIDIRAQVFNRIKQTDAIDLGHPKQDFSATEDTYSADFTRAIKGHHFDLAVIDENRGNINWGTNILYRQLRGCGVPVVGYQEGLVSDNADGLNWTATNFGACFDYSLCVGRFDHEGVCRRNPAVKDRIIPVGVPDNDSLGNISVKPFSQRRHILVVPSRTRLSSPFGPSKIYAPLTDEILDSCGLYELAEKYDSKIVIKEKGKSHNTVLAFEHLRSERIDVTWDEKNIDELVADSKFVIGAPTTLLLKPIQLRIPTAVFGTPLMGCTAAYEHFEGFTDSSREQVVHTLETQLENGGTSDDFINFAINGGSDFSSTDLFVDAVEKIGRNPSCYLGPLFYGERTLKERIWMTYPRQYKRWENVYSYLKPHAKRILGRV